MIKCKYKVERPYSSNTWENGYYLHAISGSPTRGVIIKSNGQLGSIKLTDVIIDKSITLDNLIENNKEVKEIKRKIKISDDEKERQYWKKTLSDYIEYLSN